MTACKVGYYSKCESSWNVPVMRCEGFNVAYLEPVEHCGRYCMGMYLSEIVNKTTMK